MKRLNKIILINLFISLFGFINCGGHGSNNDMDIESDSTDVVADEAGNEDILGTICKDIDCSGHGKCINNNGEPACDCDNGYYVDGLECKETECTCNERTRVHYKKCVFSKSCVKNEDCCPENIPSPYVCNQDYPYIFECHDGFCSDGFMCTKDEQCTTDFEKLHGSDSTYDNLGCIQVYDDICTNYTLSQCVYKKRCTTEEDCCPADIQQPYVCNRDIPYLYECTDGYCETKTTCDSNDQCLTNFEVIQAANSDMVNLGCVSQSDECTGETLSYCVYKESCESFNDCCPENIPSPYECNNNYPYIYVCKEGFCESNISCINDDHCDLYYEENYANDPSIENMGCLNI